MASKFFHQENREKSYSARRLYAISELIYTFVDFMAAVLFLVGSWLFFYPSLQDPAIWCFVVGSACFALKPTIRFARELKLAAMGDERDLSKRD